MDASIADQPDTLVSLEACTEAPFDSDSIQPQTDLFANEPRPAELMLEPSNNNNSYLDLDQSDLYKNDVTNELIIDESVNNESVNEGGDVQGMEAKKALLIEKQKCDKEEEEEGGMSSKMEVSESLFEFTAKELNSNDKTSKGNNY